MRDFARAQVWPGLARASCAEVHRGADLAVIARQAVLRFVRATADRRATIRSARIVVVASAGVFGQSRAQAAFATIAARARVAVIARRRGDLLRAASRGLATVVGARIAVVASHAGALAFAKQAGVLVGAQTAVVARRALAGDVERALPGLEVALRGRAGLIDHASL